MLKDTVFLLDIEFIFFLISAIIDTEIEVFSMFIGKYNKSVIVTYLGVLSTMIGIYAIIGYSEPALHTAMVCLMLAGICDMFDGKVARMFKNRTEEDKQYGVQIDSLTDMISFIAFPVVTLYGMSKYFNVTLNPFLAVLGVTLFAVAGISRLAFFNVTANGADGPIKHYSGLPVTMTSAVFPLIYLLRYLLSANIFVYVYLLFFFVVALFFVLNIKIRKPKKTWWYVMCCILTVVMSTVLIYLHFR